MSLSNEKTKLNKLKIHLIDTKESLFENIFQVNPGEFLEIDTKIKKQKF